MSKSVINLNRTDARTEFGIKELQQILIGNTRLLTKVRLKQNQARSRKVGQA